MTREVLDLEGSDWQLREALGETWRWHVDAPAVATAGNNVEAAAARATLAPGWLPASVPSSVRGDLLRAGEIPSPHVGRNSRLSEWVSIRSWIYRRTVSLRRLAPGERAVLESDGIDPSALVFVDGHEVGMLARPFGRASLNLTPWLRDGGTHTLTLVLPPAPDSQPQVGRTELVRIHAPRITYGWDFCPRIVHQGVWSGLRIVLAHVYADAIRAEAQLDGSRGLVHIVGRLDADPGTRVEVRAVVLHGDRLMVEDRRLATADADGHIELDATLIVTDPEPWWPHGYGDPVLHTVRIEAMVLGRESEPADIWSRRVGFRRVEQVPNPDGPPGALPYGLRVNGVNIPALGWNWAPADALFGEITADKVRHLLLLARSSGARLLRVWGGGLIETDTFYDLCDDLGLLVWQELSQSSSGMQSAPATDQEFVALLAEAAQHAIAIRGHHPSLVLWGGGNELDLDGVPLDESRSPALAAIRAVVEDLAPGAGWLPTSPSGPQFHNRLDVIAADPDGLHDVHGPWEHQGLVGQHTLANAGTCLAHTEFGVEGMANRRMLDAIVPAGQLLPLDRSNPVHRHLGDWWDNAPLVDELFGGRPGPLGAEAVRRASQFLQATGLAVSVEADRRRAPRCSMILPWQLAESFPTTWCTAVVDHRGDAKPAFHAVARAFAPERATLRVERAVWGGEDAATAEVWLWSETGRAAGGSLELSLLCSTGSVLASTTFDLGPVGVPRLVGCLVVPLPVSEVTGAVLWRAVWTAADGSIIDDERLVASLGEDWSALLDLAPACIEVTVTEGLAPVAASTRSLDPATGGDPWIVSVRHVAGPVVLGLELLDARPAAAPGWAVLAGDPRPFLPGEERTFQVAWCGDGAAKDARALYLESWSTIPIRLAPKPLSSTLCPTVQTF